MKKNKVKSKNLHNYPTPYNIRLVHVGVAGETYAVRPAENLRSTQKWPVGGRFFD